MGHDTTRYLRRVKAAVAGDPAVALVFVCNFEVERQWAQGYVGLPAAPFSATAAAVRQMEQLGVLLAGPDDYVVLKQPLDPSYQDYLAGLGIGLPTILVPEHVETDRGTAEDVLDSPRLLARLGELGRAGARLMPMGTSAMEQKLASAAPLPLAVPETEVFEHVNGKAYSRRITRDLGLRPVPGHSCDSVAELAEVLTGYRTAIEHGLRVVVKDSYGVSGRGLVVLDTTAKLDRLLTMVKRRADRTGDPRLQVVVEEWLAKRCDLNHQVTIGRDGSVTVDFVKQALTENGVHKGHLMPAELSTEQEAELEHAAHAIAARLYADGYFGVAGIDAIVGVDEIVYPVLEINARLNMATYQGGLTERLLPPGHVALANHYPLLLSTRCDFDRLSGVLDPLLAGTADGRLVITCFGTVNAGAEGSAAFEGRLYTLLVAPDRDRLAGLDTAARQALAGLDEGATHR